MHDIEPYFKWREYYIASEDKKSIFYKKQYNEFSFEHKIYNYYIHPQWDDFGSQTLYCKVLYANYDEKVAMLELIGEWNDCLYNDIMFFKRSVIDNLQKEGVSKFILFCDNVLNFHGDDASYYEEWAEEVNEEYGYICFVNTLDHVTDEMEKTQLQYHVHIGDDYNELNWRTLLPPHVMQLVEKKIKKAQKQLDY